MSEQPTLVKFGGQPCVIMDPAKYPQARGKANGYCCPLGKSPGIGYVLMLRSAWDRIKDRRNSPQTLEVLARQRITLPAMYIISAVKISGGRPNDPNSVYMVKFTDKRWIAAKLSDVTKQINVRCPAPPETAAIATKYYEDSLNAGAAYSWTAAVQAIWESMPILGAFGSLPYTPHSVPENYQFLGVNAWDALHVLLDRLQCAVAYDPVADTFAIVKLGSTQADLADLFANGDPYLDDAEPFDTTVEDSPATIRVYFSRADLQYGSGFETKAASGTWATSLLTAVDTASGIAGAAPGTVLALWDDLAATADFVGAISNQAALDTRAAERVANWKAERATSSPRLRTVYQGIVSGFRPGSQLKYVWWRNTGEGWMTEVARHAGMMKLVDDAGGLRTEAADTLGTPDVVRRRHPNYPQYLQLVTVDSESPGEDPGTVVPPTASGLFPGLVTRMDPDADTATSGCFGTAEACWLLVVNRTTGSASVSPTLTKGERYLGRLCGSKLLGADPRPVYLIHKDEAGERSDVVIVTDSPGIDVGDPVSTGTGMKCLWPGIVATVNTGAATFCSGTDRYTDGDPCWILCLDILNGSATPGAWLLQGDRFIGKLVGTYTIDDDERPLYAVRKGCQTAIVQIAGDDADAGEPAAPDASGVWDGFVVTPDIGATDFSPGNEPYTERDPCWILAVDKPGGSITPYMQMKKGDRFTAIHLGTMAPADADNRPLYAVRKGISFGWIRFAIYGTPLTFRDEKCVGEVLEQWGDVPEQETNVYVWNLLTQIADRYKFHGQVGATGYATWNSNTEVDGVEDEGTRGKWVIVVLDPIAEFIEGTMADPFANFAFVANKTTSVVDVDEWWGGAEPQSGVHVYDKQGLFKRAKDEAKFIAVYNERLIIDEGEPSERVGAYVAIECQSKAGWIDFTLTNAMASGSSADATVDRFGGSQQDIQSPEDPGGTPGAKADVYDDQDLWKYAPVGAKGRAIYDAVEDKYRIVACQKKAKFIEFTIAGSNLLTTDASKASCTVDDFWDGVSPGSTVDIYNKSISSNYLFEGVVGHKGIAVYDEIEDKYRIIQMECP